VRRVGGGSGGGEKVVGYGGEGKASQTGLRLAGRGGNLWPSVGHREKQNQSINLQLSLQNDNRTLM